MPSPEENTREWNARLDTLFGALADEQRRQMVRYVQSVEDDVAPVAAFIDYTVADTSVGQTREQLETKLRHVTLPKLADSGLIEWHETTNEVTKGPHFEEAQRFLESLARDDEERLSMASDDD